MEYILIVAAVVGVVGVCVIYFIKEKHNRPEEISQANKHEKELRKYRDAKSARELARRRWKKK